MVALACGSRGEASIRGRGPAQCANRCESPWHDSVQPLLPKLALDAFCSPCGGSTGFAPHRFRASAFLWLVLGSSHDVVVWRSSGSSHVWAEVVIACATYMPQHGMPSRTICPVCHATRRRWLCVSVHAKTGPARQDRVHAFVSVSVGSHDAEPPETKELTLWEKMEATTNRQPDSMRTDLARVELSLDQ